MIQHLRSLSAGRPIVRPVYLFPEHVRAPRGEPVQPTPCVIIEGLFALYWEEVRGLLHTRVFVELDDAVCLARRLDRDTRERGRTAASGRAQYETTVRPMYERHVQPTQRHADVVVGGDGSLAEAVAAVTAAVGPLS